MALNPTELRKLKDAFNTWANNVPNPDEPVMSLGHGFLSAKELAKEVENETEDGKYIVCMIEHAISATGSNLDREIERITRRSPKP